jgi:hypothetical protein
MVRLAHMAKRHALLRSVILFLLRPDRSRCCQDIVNTAGTQNGANATSSVNNVPATYVNSSRVFMMHDNSTRRSMLLNAPRCREITTRPSEFVANYKSAALCKAMVTENCRKLSIYCRFSV